MKILLGFFTLCICALGASSQDTLSLNDAIARGLSNNYNIKFATLDRDAAIINNSSGAAGMLPSVDLRVADQYSSNNILQRFSNGTEITSPNANGNNLSASISANWTVFDGLKMFATKERLEEFEKVGNLQLQKQISTSIRDITVAYSTLQQLQLQREYLQTLIAFNELRTEITNIRLTAGNGAKTDFLQASIDLNTGRAQLIDVQNQMEIASSNLKILMKENQEGIIRVQKYSELKNSDLDRLKEKIAQDNLDVELANRSVSIANLQMKEAKAAMLPTLSINGAYNLARTDNSAGFSLFNRSFGPSVGATLTLPIFNGGQVNRSVQLSKIQFQQSELWMDQVRVETNARSNQLFARVSNLMDLQKIYQESLDMSSELLDLALERFKQGQSSSLEVQQAQVSYNNVNSLFLENNFQLQIAISDLKLLAGDIE